MIKQLLLAPGPTPVPWRVLLAMARPVTRHRAPRLSALFAEVRNGVRSIFATQEDVVILAASGTGATLPA